MHRKHPRAGAHGADVEHEHLALAELAHLALLLAALPSQARSLKRRQAVMHT